MKPSAGGNNGLNRREVLCTPKKVKLPAREKRQPPDAATLAAGKVYAPPHLNGGVNGAVDQSAVLELFAAGAGKERSLDSVSDFSVADSDHENAEGLQNSDDNSDDDSGVESDEESDEDSAEEEEEDGERAGGDKKESLKESLDLEDALLWEMEQNPHYGEEVDLAAEWELSQARKKGLRGEGDAKSRAKDGGLKRGADRKTAKRRTGGGGGNDSGAAGDELGGDSRRERPTKRREGGQGDRRDGGRGGGGRGAGRGGGGRGGGYGRGTPHSPAGTGHSGSFQWGAGRGGGFPGRGRGDGGRLGGRGGLGDDGERKTPPPPPVRSTPYKWGTTSKVEGQGATAAAATAVPAPALAVAPAAGSQALGEGSEPRRAETEARQQGGEGRGGGGGGGDFDDDRGGAFRAKFGGGGTAAVAARRGGGGGGDGGSGQQHRSTPEMTALSLKELTSEASTDRFQFPTQPAAASFAPIVPSREASVQNSHSHGGSSPADSRGDSNRKPAEREGEPDSGKEGREE